MVAGVGVVAAGVGVGVVVAADSGCWLLVAACFWWLGGFGGWLAVAGWWWLG